MKRHTVRQGDVLLVPVDAIPDGAVKADPGRIEGRIVLAYGEVTGHHHSVAVADAELVVLAEAVYLRIMAPTPLEHQEHAAIALSPGAYRVVRQMEYSPAAIRSVAD